MVNVIDTQIGTDTANVTALTCQELFARMETLTSEEHAEYMAYLRNRYVAGLAGD